MRRRESVLWQQLIENPGGSLLNRRERFGKRFLIALVECNVVRCCRVGFQPHASGNNVSHSFRLCFLKYLWQAGFLFLVMEHLMSEFVSQDRELLSRLQARNQPDCASVGNPLGRRNRFVVFDRDSLFGNQRLELVREFPGIARSLGELRQRLAFGLLDIEDEGGTEPGEPENIVLLGSGRVWAW